MIYKGLKFGMLLQFAVGPVCIFIFQIAALKGFRAAMSGVLGVAIIDGLFILTAILGIASVIEKESTKKFFNIFGAIVLFIFGISTVLSVLNVDFLPALSLRHIPKPTNAFVQAIILTAANPLTIIFWAGIFSAKIAEENMKRTDIYAFGLGAFMSTLFFLTLISLLGSFTNKFFPPYIVKMLNLSIGFLLIYFGMRMLLRKV